MNQLNSLILEGNITRIPDVKETAHGFKVCRVPLAVNRFYKNNDGENIQEVSYFDVETFGKLAEFCEKNSDKGRGMRVVGRLKQDRWKTTDGKNTSRISIIAEHIEFKPRMKKDTEGEMATEISDESLNTSAESLETTVKEESAAEEEITF
jgi:single-strand DNA-binding protein